MFCGEETFLKKGSLPALSRHSLGRRRNPNFQKLSPELLLLQVIKAIPICFKLSVKACALVVIASCHAPYCTNQRQYSHTPPYIPILSHIPPPSSTVQPAYAENKKGTAGFISPAMPWGNIALITRYKRFLHRRQQRC